MCSKSCLHYENEKFFLHNTPNLISKDIKSTWIVPHSTLLAIRTINNISEKVSDQTVWIIDKYDNGYITGTSYTAIDKTPTAKNSIVGSITPDGKVTFAFYSDTNVTEGNGTFDDGEFTMQMNSLATISSGIIGISHWSYMRLVTPCDHAYRHLPGIGISVPEFIKLFD